MSDDIIRKLRVFAYSGSAGKFLADACIISLPSTSASNDFILKLTYMSVELVPALITTISGFIFKIGVLFVGYLIARMGYDLLLKGVTGKFKFKTYRDV